MAPWHCTIRAPHDRDRDGGHVASLKANSSVSFDTATTQQV
ncbi:MAG: hypothetical protein VKK80_17050 [Prochlorothrix sp.]|nr:hypothetical protein [Prochlorothrix sp.]